MNLLRRLASLFSGGGTGSADKRYLTIYVLSRRCNEPISGQVDLLNELSKDDESSYAFYTRKVLHTSGDRRCFSQVEVQLYFNQNKQVAHYEVEGGRWLSSEEYAEELARFNAPPPEDEEENEVEAEEGAETTQALVETEGDEAAPSSADASGSPQPNTKENDHA